MVKDILVKYSKEIAYVIGSIIYMLFLHDFNKEVIRLGISDKIFELLAYNNYAAIWLFILAMIFVITGIFVFSPYVKGLFNDDIFIPLYRCIIGIMILLVILFIIIYLISNPILKAILGVTIIAVAYLKS